MEIVDFDEAMKHVHSGSKIYVHGSASTPDGLLKALVDRCQNIEDVTLYHIEIGGSLPHMKKEMRGKIKDVSLFVGKEMRKYVSDGSTDYLPIFLSDIPWFIREELRPDVTFINVSRPDSHSFVSLGPTIIGIRAAIESSETVIAQLNENVPRTFGDSTVPTNMIDFAVKHDEKLVEEKGAIISKTERKIAEHIEPLIPNRATIQAGIGSIPDAVMPMLDGKRDLGIHTELLSRGMVDLIESGTVTNRSKNIDRNHSIATFSKGTNYVYDFLNDNPMVLMKSVDYTNDTSTIRRNDYCVSINSAVEIDISGQVAAESVGSRVISGVGGQMDFVRGSSLSRGGKAIIAMASTTARGESKIVPYLKQGAAVTTTRNHVQFVVTEFGIADLRGKSLTERARELIAIAHPDHIPALESYAKKILPNL